MCCRYCVFCKDCSSQFSPKAGATDGHLLLGFVRQNPGHHHTEALGEWHPGHHVMMKGKYPDH